MFLFSRNKIDVKQIILAFIVFSITFNFCNAQLTTDNSQTVQAIINNLVGQGITVSNIKYTGDATARGLFNGVSSNIGISSGVILSTGAISNATGPNNDPLQGSCLPANIKNSSEFGRAGDKDLEALTGNVEETYDAAVLEFDFIPQSTPLTFNYVFASEEYPCFVCSPFNDVFGFLISGPNPSGGQYTKKNIALIPTTTTYVAINSVNSGKPGHDPISGNDFPTSNCTSLKYAQYFVDNGTGSTPGINTKVQYNGFTTVFTSTIPVVPCSSAYHIKLAIADGGDGKYDSAILLQANSFVSHTMDVSVTFSNAVDTFAVKNCNDAIIKFTLPKAALHDTTITFVIGGTGANGTDYQQVSGSIVIRAGQTTGSFSIVPLTSTEKTVTISVYVASCSQKTYTIYIKPNGLAATITASSTDTLCFGNSATFTVKPSNANYSYLWSNDSTKSSFRYTNNNSTNGIQKKTFTVTVTDKRTGCTAIGSINVYGFPEITKFFKPNKDTTGFNPLKVNFRYTGTNNITWIFGDNSTSHQSNVDHVYKFDAGSANGNDSRTFHARIKMGNCEDSVDITVRIPVILNIPNVFTPNGDGKNEYFSFEGVGITTAEVTILNRWGDKIFHKSYDISTFTYDKTTSGSGADTKNYIMWDGKTKSGSKVDDGIYYYVLKPLDSEGNKINPKEGKLNGSITVIK
jgi:gliding motility-associated-like protein